MTKSQYSSIADHVSVRLQKWWKVNQSKSHSFLVQKIIGPGRTSTHTWKTFTSYHAQYFIGGIQKFLIWNFTRLSKQGIDNEFSFIRLTGSIKWLIKRPLFGFVGARFVL